MCRWIWIVCLLNAVIIPGTLTQTTGVQIQYGAIDLGWERIGEEGGDDRAENVTLFELTDNKYGNKEEGIAFGYNTKPGQFPYMTSVMIQYYGYYYHICGGVIYDRHTVITVAHCLRYIKYYTYYVGVGFYDLKLGLYNPGSQIIKVSSYTIHSQFDLSAPGIPNNIALLHLDCRIKYNTYVQPATLATKYDGKFANSYCYIIGFGKTKWGYPRILQQAYIYGINNYMCKLFWAVATRAKILQNHLCVYKFPVSACQGDTGGPIVCGGKVAGLISWGRSYCIGCFPTVCTRISMYGKWISKMSVPE